MRTIVRSKTIDTCIFSCNSIRYTCTTVLTKVDFVCAWILMKEKVQQILTILKIFLYLDYPLSQPPYISTTLYPDYPLSQPPYISTTLYLNYNLSRLRSFSITLYLNCPITQLLYISTTLYLENPLSRLVSISITLYLDYPLIVSNHFLPSFHKFPIDLKLRPLKRTLYVLDQNIDTCCTLH